MKPCNNLITDKCIDYLMSVEAAKKASHERRLYFNLFLLPIYFTQQLNQ